MKFIILVLLALALFYSYYVYGPSSAQTTEVEMKNVSNGVVKYGKETLAYLQANGFVTLDGTTVRKTLFVNGSLAANKARVNALHVNGHASVSECVVDGKSQVNGFLCPEHSTFRSELILSVQSVNFKDCTLESLVIKKPLWVFGRQVIELSDKTVCKGPITFEGGNGKVILSGNSQVLGPVQGAEVEKQ